jgi:hypothetical protein
MMMDAKPEYPDEAIPKDSFFSDNKQIYFNGEGIEVWELPHAHSAGDVIVFFRKSDACCQRPVSRTHPVFDVEAGDASGCADAMNRIVPMMIPRFSQMDGARILQVTAGSPISPTSQNFGTWRRSFAIASKPLIDKGSLEQVKAARATLDATRYSAQWAWSTEKHRGCLG